MWTALPQFLLRYWHVTVIAFLIAFGAMQTMRLKAEKRDHQATKTEYEIQRRLAQAATDKQKQEYDDALLSASQRTTALVAQAEAGAWANYIKRYGPPKSVACPVVRVGFDGVQPLPPDPATGANQAASPGSADDPRQEFVADCAADAARLAGWQTWATNLNLPIKE